MSNLCGSAESLQALSLVQEVNNGWYFLTSKVGDGLRPKLKRPLRVKALDVLYK